MRKLLFFLIFLFLLLAVATWFISRGSTYEAFDADINGNRPASELIKENKSRILWSDSEESKTEWSIVYLDVLPADSKKADPIITKLNQHFGMNTYTTPSYSGEDISPKWIVEEMKEAINIGQGIGEKVIVIGNAISAAPLLYIAGKNQRAVDALILYSPTLETNYLFSDDLLSPWSRVKSYFGESSNNSAAEANRAYTYLIRETMTDENFMLIEQPYFISYYFQDDHTSDKNVSVESINRLDSLSKTNSRLKRTIVVDRINVGWQKEYLETQYFIEEVLKVKPKTIL